MLDLKKHSSNDSIETPATFDDRISTVISSTLSFSPSLSRRGCWECRSVERILLREISDRRSEISRGGMCSSDKERRNGVFLFARLFSSRERLAFQPLFPLSLEMLRAASKRNAFQPCAHKRAQFTWPATSQNLTLCARLSFLKRHRTYIRANIWDFLPFL